MTIRINICMQQLNNDSQLQSLFSNIQQISLDLFSITKIDPTNGMPK